MGKPGPAPKQGFSVRRCDNVRQYNREWALRRYFNMTIADYRELLDKQGGVCAICKSSDPGCKGETNELAFHVDHCHETNKIRGLLCGPCNRGLGYFKDNLDSLKNAMEYLKDG